MRQLVALDMEAGPQFVTSLRRAWDAGDAALAVDQRLPPPARTALLDALRPTVIETADGQRPWPGGRPVETGDALVVATSGTTGLPKGVILTHDAVRASALATSRQLGVDPDCDHWLACLPVAHIGGLSVITRAIHTGTPLTVLPAFDAAIVEDAPARLGATLTSLVVAALTRVEPSHWRVILLGGSAMPPGLPPNAVRTYGMTETGSGLVYDGFPIDGAEIRVDATGQIEVRGPMLMRAYRSAATDTDPRSSDGWFATGDAGSIGQDGCLRVDGRIGDVIVTGAEKVWPEGVERVLAGCTAVREAAVAGRPDAEWGHRVVAFVVPADPDDPPRLEMLRDHVKASLPSYAAPRELVLVDRIPRTALGKVQRHALLALRATV